MFSGIAGAIAGPLIGGAVSAFGQHQANKAGAANVQAQMDFQERMSNTAYQRSMEDMRKAGLNPILAYKQGGASAPTGSAFTPQNVAQGATNTVSSAMAGKRLRADLKNLDATNKNIVADTQLKATQQHTVNMQGMKIGEENKILRQNYHSAVAAARNAQIETKMLGTPGGHVLRIIDLIGRALWPGAGVGTKLKALGGK